MPASANLLDLIAARADNPDKMALETSDAMALTYGALLRRSAQAANALVARGVEPGDRVAAQIDKSTDAIVVALACLRAGAALLPLNTAYTLAELGYFLGDAEPALTLCRPEQLSSTRELASRLGLEFGREPRRRPRRNLRRPHRRRAGGLRNDFRVRKTIWRRSSTRPAPPAAPKAR